MGYIVLVVKPDLSLIPVVWAGILIAAYSLGSRLGTEIFRGWEHSRSRNASDLRQRETDPADGVD
jgi:hypothetical protein